MLQPVRGTMTERYALGSQCNHCENLLLKPAQIAPDPDFVESTAVPSVPKHSHHLGTALLPAPKAPGVGTHMGK